MPTRPGWKVAVVTTFVPRDEPIEMLGATVSAMVACEYPHDTWVLDEGNDPQVVHLCDRLGAHHFTRSNNPEYLTSDGTFQSFSKHGNYNAWLHEIGFDRYDLVTIFDPDHIPHRCFLSRVLGYFEDSKVACVQAAQAYYNQNASFIARGAAEETYGYYSSIQMASYRLGFPIITGSHNTHRMKALKEIGGFPAHDAEDLLISLLYPAGGWQGVYVPEILAKGLAPVDWTGYLTQQRRWARSVLDIKIRHLTELSQRMNLPARAMSCLHGLNYLHKSLVILVGLLLLAFMLVENTHISFLPSTSTASRFVLMCIALQAGELYRQRFYLDWKVEWGSHWRILILHYAKWPFFLMALWDVLSARKLPYALTVKTESKGRKSMLLFPNLIVILTLILCGVVGIAGNHIFNPFLHILAAILILGSGCLIWSERFQFPPPFEPELLKEPGYDYENSSAFL
jgi:cellulose synthase (UDP-forming)